METNRYNDHRYNNVESLSMGQQQFVTPAQTYRPQQRVEQQKPRPAQRMPKAQAQSLSRNLKKAVAVASVLGFGAFSGLIAYHQINAATTTTATTTTPSSTQSSQSTGNSSSFFNQQGDSNVGTSSTSSTTQKSNSGTGSTSSSTAAPVTGTSVS